MYSFQQLRFGNIIGIVDSYGAVHSEWTGTDVKFHAEIYPTAHHCHWRWDFNKSLWAIAKETAPNKEQWDAIMIHLEKKYGIKFWDNGHHDLDFFLARLEKEREELEEDAEIALRKSLDKML